jgi:hypothetical protein
MNSLPAVLFPCRIVIAVAGFLVPRGFRTEWRREWISELWHRRNAFAWEGRWWPQAVWSLYRDSFGAFPDAWWHMQEDGELLRQVAAKTRSAEFCLGCLAALLLTVFIGSGFLPATRVVFSDLPYEDSAHLAVISRTGRLDPVQRGVPVALARPWKRDSRIVKGLAVSSFARKLPVMIGGTQTKAVAITASANLFDVLGVKLPTAAQAADANGGTVYLSKQFWEKTLHRMPVAGRTIRIRNRMARVAGVLPEGIWFLSPVAAVYELDSGALSTENMFVVRCRTTVSAGELEQDLTKLADRQGLPFLHTTPHAVFLKDAAHTPLWLFAACVVLSGVMVLAGAGSRLLRLTNPAGWLPRMHWRNCAFFLLKTGMLLVFVLVTGIEIFTGGSRQSMSEVLGGPLLMWFYIVGCSVVLFLSLSDHHARCHVCQRMMAFPIQIGCPGCLLLEWSGTELVCPEGHGALYVPDHMSCWEDNNRWVLTEF